MLKWQNALKCVLRHKQQEEHLNTCITYTHTHIRTFKYTHIYSFFPHFLAYLSFFASFITMPNTNLNLVLTRWLLGFAPISHMKMSSYCLLSRLTNFFIFVQNCEKKLNSVSEASSSSLETLYLKISFIFSELNLQN